MAREIRLSGIGEHFEGKVIRTVKKATPVDTGNLKGSWQNDIQPFIGEVFTDVEYAEPVAYGTSLPPSWGGRYRTRPDQNTIKGYPELIAKQLEGFIEDEFRRD